jgi:Holliday junction DNA helicase RuvB
MEDYALDLVIGEGPSARSIRIDLSPFTLVGATTRAGLLSTPLRDRFGIVSRLDFYSVADLELILCRAALKMGAQLTPDGASEIARRARGTPRIAVRLLRRVRDFADALGTPLDAGTAANGLARLDIDPDGLDMLDRRYLKALVETYGGGPVGVETLAAAISEARDGVEDVIEPYLMQQGFIMRTPRGRVAAARAYSLFGLPEPKTPPQSGLFGE